MSRAVRVSGLLVKFCQFSQENKLIEQVADVVDDLVRVPGPYRLDNRIHLLMKNCVFFLESAQLLPQ